MKPIKVMGREIDQYVDKKDWAIINNVFGLDLKGKSYDTGQAMLDLYISQQCDLQEDGGLNKNAEMGLGIHGRIWQNFKKTKEHNMPEKRGA